VSDGPSICVVIVTYKSDDTIPRCMAALAAQTYRNFEVVIVENGETPAARTIIEALNVPARLIEPSDNLGFAAGNNLGVASAAAHVDWIATLNPDAFPDAGWLAEFVAATARYPRCSIFGSLQMQDTDAPKVDGLGDCYHAFGFAWRGGRKDALPPDLEDTETFSPCAAAAFYRRSVFEALGGFDESYFNYMEDVDLGFRFRLAGHACVQLARARVVHVGGASATSEFAVFHGLRNTALTFVKDMPALLMWPLLPFHIAAIAALCLYNALKGNGRAALEGVGAALARLGSAFAVRRAIQRRRTASTGAIARALTWSWVAPVRMTASRRPPPESVR
jgi:N-acetylglucosaminyl-diphospho-decaprenol L-rhamnosyltransferase